MSNLITLNLTVGEIIVLQELTEDMDTSSIHLEKIADTLRKKAFAAYKKPVMSQEEFQRRLADVRERWKGMPIENDAVRNEEQYIRFYFDVEEKNDEA